MPELKPIRQTFDAFANELPKDVEVVVVAGALRNIVLGKQPKDVDFLFRFKDAPVDWHALGRGSSG